MNGPSTIEILLLAFVLACVAFALIDWGSGDGPYYPWDRDV